MKTKFARVWSGAAALAVVASTAPFFNVTAAYAAGTLAGAATVRNAGGAAALASGDSATTFTLRLPANASCAGDGGAGYRWHTYMVPASVDPSTLTFGANGPLPAGTGASFRQPLYTNLGSPVSAQFTAAANPPAVTGQIINIPDMDYAVFSPGDIPPGPYNIGIACTQNAASPTQMKDYWNVQKTFTTNAAGGPAQVNWGLGAIPAAPALTAVTPGDGTLTATFTASASDPATTVYTATATAGASTVTGTSATVSPIVISGLTNGTSYSVTVTATNALGVGPASNAISGTPVLAARPPVTGLTAVPGTGRVDLSWTAPTGPVPTGYSVTVSPVAGTVVVSGTTAAVTGLTAGTNYTFTVTPLHPAPFTATPATTGPIAPLSAQVLVHDVTVVRPTGAIVLTQVCGRFGALDADAPATPGFPAGSLPALAAVSGGTAPTLAAGGGGADPAFAGYPYPENADGTPNATYPTHCGIGLGNAKLVKSGPGAGQFFAASGRLNQVTVVDTRDTDTGWTVNGTMGQFSSGPAASQKFSGSQLGWTPVRTSDTPAFTDSDDVSYDQVAAAGAVVNPNSSNSAGLSTGKALGSAAALAGSAPTFTGGLGLAEFDARLKLLIPITKVSGTYVGTLTLTVA